MINHAATFVPWIVYENLVLMMQRRRATLSGAPLTRIELADRLNDHEYAVIDGVRTDDPHDPRPGAVINIVLIAPGSKYATKSMDFNKLFKSLPKQSTQRQEIIFVSELDMTPHIKRHIHVHRSAYTNIFIEDYSYDIFKIDAPSHSLVPPHIVMTEAEVEELCSRNKTNRKYFPQILHTDPQAVWLGLQPGMCVKILRVSETAGTAVAYRYCVKNTSA